MVEAFHPLQRKARITRPRIEIQPISILERRQATQTCREFSYKDKIQVKSKFTNDAQ